MFSINNSILIDTNDETQMKAIETQLGQLSTAHQLRRRTRCLGHFNPDSHKKSNGHSKNRKISIKVALEMSNNDPEIRGFTVTREGLVWFHNDVTNVVNRNSSEELKSIDNGGGDWKTMIFIEKY